MRRDARRKFAPATSAKSSRAGPAIPSSRHRRPITRSPAVEPGRPSRPYRFQIRRPPAASVIGPVWSRWFVQRAGPCFCPWSAWPPHDADSGGGRLKSLPRASKRLRKMRARHTLVPARDAARMRLLSVAAALMTFPSIVRQLFRLPPSGTVTETATW